MEVGPDKLRRRSTVNVKPMPMKFQLTLAQVAYLDTFFTTTCSETAQFEFVHPRTGATINLRFIGPPKHVNLGGDIWHSSCNFEVLP